MKKLFFLVGILVVGLTITAFTVSSTTQQSTIKVSGWVENTDGDALFGVEVKSSHSSSATTTTDREGFYSISIPQSQSTTISFSLSGYQDCSESVNSSSDTELSVVMSRQ